ncbi:MAG: serine/threonine protein kinase [Bacteroidetes bacterium]|nr:serine/threonine protein kinase [Bacteroidota bacterium]MBU2507050.1 serine/threonine protein kinase [Bacteroidota bacterium]
MSLFTGIIKKYFTDTIAQRGRNYFNLKLVDSFEIKDDYFTAAVWGSKKYLVKISFARDLEPIDLDCTCPYFDTAECKHLAAFVCYLNSLGYFDEDKKLPELRKIAEMSPDYLSDFDNVYEKVHQLIPKKELAKIKLESEAASLKSVFSPFVNQQKPFNKDTKIIQKMGYAITLSHQRMSIKPVKQRIRDDGSVASVDVASRINYDKVLPISFEEKILLDYLSEHIFETYYFGYYDSSQEAARKRNRIDEIFKFLPGKDVYVSDYHNYDKIDVLKSHAQAYLHIEENDENLTIQLVIEFDGNKIISSKEFLLVLDDPLWIYTDKKIFKVNNLSHSQLSVFSEKNFRIDIPKWHIEVFENEMLPKIASQIPIISNKYEIQEIREIPAKKILLEEDGFQLLIKLKFGYGDNELDYNPAEEFTSLFHNGKIFTVYRDKEFEQSAYESIRSLHVKFVDNGVFSPRQKPIDFLFSNFNNIKEMGFEILGEEKLNAFKVNTSYPKISFKVTSGIDWFDLDTEIDFSGTHVTFSDLKAAIKSKKHYVRLSDGSTGILPAEWINKFSHSFALGEARNSKIRFSHIQALALDSIIEETDNSKLDKIFRERVNKLRSFEKVTQAKLPDNFIGNLRDYQKAGFDWFYFLKEYSFGGILADDMGLGKTIQAITLLLKEKSENKDCTSLIITPTSVVFNWIDEINKFAPSLSVLSHTGIERVKNDQLHFKKYDVVITSYGIILRDYKFLTDFRFHYIILDESQKIKNPISKTGKVVRCLKSNYRLCLTGTPIENNLAELWSQMTFLNPGLLGSYNKFTESFVKVIQKNGDGNAIDLLKKTIYPFVLRRTKDLVAKELPPKIETIHYCEMEKDQARVYNLWKDSIRFEILKEIETKGIKKSGFKVLEGLLRLRQICNHPILVDSGYKKKSSKFEEFKIMLAKVVSEGHKALVFSQFVQMLEIMKTHLEKEKIKYEYLTGRTINREERIKNFKESDELKIFLISLKAGGFGLNLTEADYVFHYDPWWNPAVENQATDRAHRIGQNKHVFIYKFITKDTIEEKILHLQEKKKKLVEEIISTDSGLLKNLTKEDIKMLFE